MGSQLVILCYKTENEELFIYEYLLFLYGHRYLISNIFGLTSQILIKSIGFKFRVFLYCLNNERQKFMNKCKYSSGNVKVSLKPSS